MTVFLPDEGGMYEDTFSGLPDDNMTDRINTAAGMKRMLLKLLFIMAGDLNELKIHVNYYLKPVITYSISEYCRNIEDFMPVEFPPVPD